MTFEQDDVSWCFSIGASFIYLLLKSLVHVVMCFWEYSLYSARNIVRIMFFHSLQAGTNYGANTRRERR